MTLSNEVYDHEEDVSTKHSFLRPDCTQSDALDPDPLMKSKYQERIMNEFFLDIAFEAEVCTKEDPELYEIAYEQCHEDLSTRDASIAELRNMIYERGECVPFRMDDDFLIKFLRATKYIIPKAHRLIVRYCAFREQYPYLYQDVDPWSLVKVKDAYEGSMFDRPDIGRLSVFRFGTWDPSEFPVEDLVRAGMLMTEIGVRQPKLQVIGGTVIVDLEGITLRHVATLTPTVAYQIVCLLGMATPCRMKACHIVNYSWILNTFIYLFKRFIPRKSWEKIYFHGYNLKSLQEHFDLECLPVRYGGTCRNFATFATWLTKIKKYRDEALDQDLKKLGYSIKE